MPDRPAHAEDELLDALRGMLRYGTPDEASRFGAESLVRHLRERLGLTAEPAPVHATCHLHGGYLGADWVLHEGEWRLLVEPCWACREAAREATAARDAETKGHDDA